MSQSVLGKNELEEYSKASNKTLVVYQVAERFCERFSPLYLLASEDIHRLINDGRQAIIDFNQNSDRSLTKILKTLGVLSLIIDELKDEFIEFLDSKHYSRWKGSSPQALFVYKLCGDQVISYQSCSEYVENNNADRVANIVICMMEHVQKEFLKDIHQIERQIKRELSITKIKGKLRD